MQNEHWQKIGRELAPSWDELRERRVLGRVLAEVRAQKSERPARHARWMAAGAGMVAAAAVSLAFLSAGPGVQTAALPRVAPANEPPSDALPPKSMLPASPVAPAVATGAPTLRFTDGSRAQLWADAQVVSTAQTEHEVVIEQHAGRVLYEVPERAERRFVVRSKNVAITVLATVFEVDVRWTEIEVRVHKGQLQVAQGDRNLSLHAGESVRLASPDESASADQTTREGEPRKSLRRQRAGQAPHHGKAKESKTAPSQPDVPTHDAMAEGLRVADQARRTGDLAGASRALQALIAEHGGDGRVSRASFTLGRVERARGRHREAARAFEACLHSDAQGPLAEDALAEAAVAWAAAGDLTRARTLATEYLARFASSTHSARIRTLME